jgi:hypothetical protein
LARALSLLVGLALVALLLVFGLVVGGVLLIGGGVLLALRYWTRGQRKVPAPTAGSQRAEVLEGEFVVVHQRGPAAH